MTATPFIVAEMSANHLGRLRTALDIVDAAADAGADAIKLQTWTPGTMCVSDYRLERGPWAGRLLRDLYEEAFTPWEWHAPIFARARERGLVPFSAAFDAGAVDFLETLGVDRHKVASFEITDIPLIRHMASKRKSMIVSTGMATEKEVTAAYSAACGVDHLKPNRVTLLRCVSEYPAPAAELSLRDIHHGPEGLSDHSEGIGVAVAAAAMGACYIEKHLTLDRSDGGLDAGFSMEPQEFRQMVIECQRAAATRGPLKRGPKPGEHTALRRSLWVTRDTSRGEALVLGINVRTARPALGLPCDTPLEAAGRSAARDLRAGEPLTAECVS